MRLACEAAESAGADIALMTAAGAALAGGPSYMMALLETGLQGKESLVTDRIVDCGDRADIVFAALNAGWRLIAFQGDDQVAEKLNSIVTNASGKLMGVGLKALDLETETDPMQAAIRWIENEQRH